MRRIQISGGTPDHSGKTLCASCRNGQMLRGQRDEMTLCHRGGMDPMRVTFKVTSCSEYADKSTPPLWELEKIAWRVSPDFAKRPAGFSPDAKVILSPSDYTKKFGED